MTTDPIEKALLEGLARNEKGAATTIYKEHYGMIQTMIINNNGTVDDARDIFQEAMVVLFEKVRSGQFELSCQLKTYIYSVCRRLWLKRLSQQQKLWVTDLDGKENWISVEEDLELQEQQNQAFHLMEKAMLSLGEPCRSLLDAFYLQKKSMVDIANSFGYTNADNAKTQKYKCLTRLKKIFFAQYKTLEV
ncbi:MAG TPA: sigma-70 family RNA polymerase sigma factor [Flavihumibacter sp.]